MLHFTLCKARRPYLLTWKVISYCFLAFQSSMVYVPIDLQIAWLSHLDLQLSQINVDPLWSKGRITINLTISCTPDTEFEIRACLSEAEHAASRARRLPTILWNSMTSTSFVFTELANTMKYGGGFLYNLVFTKWWQCVSQNEVRGGGVM